MAALPGRRLVLLGFGSVNTALVKIILQKRELLEAGPGGVRLRIVGVCDSGGARRADSEDGLDMEQLLSAYVPHASVLPPALDLSTWYPN